jgi:hypothetical protein
LLEPTAEGTVERVPCFPPLFQRIVDRDYGNDSASTFLAEIPLSELVEWNMVRGSDLAQRATDNTLRYHALFCSVVDELMATMEPSRSSNDRAAQRGQTVTLLRDTMDILQVSEVSPRKPPKIPTTKQGVPQMSRQTFRPCCCDATNCGFCHWADAGLCFPLAINIYQRRPALPFPMGFPCDMSARKAWGGWSPLRAWSYEPRT